MEDSSQFMQWAMNTLQHERPAPSVVDDHCGQATLPSLQHLRDASYAAEMVQELITKARAAANSWSSGGHISAPAAMDHDVCPSSPSSARRAPRTSANLPVSWNFSAALAQPGTGSDGGMLEAASPPSRGSPDELVYGSPPTRRAGLKNAGPASSLAPYAQGHTVAERKRREKINQRFVELSAVIPGLKKMDKATILSDATRYVKELQEKLKALEAAGSDVIKSIDEDGALAARKLLPEIDARFLGNIVMVRIHCDNGKGVVVRVLAVVEELHVSIVDANVIPFPGCTLIITIAAKVEAGFTVSGGDHWSDQICIITAHYYGTTHS